MSSYEIFEKVLDFINSAQKPVSSREISENLNISRASLSRILNTLMNENKISVIKGKESIQDGMTRQISFYISKNKNGTAEQAKINQDYVDKIEPLEKRLSEIDVKYNEIVKIIDNHDKQINTLYSNIIAIMGVFVSIFSLIILNITTIQSIAEKKCIDLMEMIGYLLILNIPLVVSIIILLFAVRFILLKRFKK